MLCHLDWFIGSKAYCQEEDKMLDKTSDSKEVGDEWNAEEKSVHNIGSRFKLKWNRRWHCKGLYVPPYICFHKSFL